MTPCAVSAALRIHQREQEERVANEPTAAELSEAREDLAWRFLSGRQYDKVLLADILDGALNGDTGVLANKLSALCSAIAGARIEAICDLEQWTRGVIDAYLEGHPDMVRDRALEMR